LELGGSAEEEEEALHVAEDYVLATMIPGSPGCLGIEASGHRFF